MTRRPKDSRRNMANVEGALQRAIEKPFASIFRSPLQPAEIEKAALREVEKSRKLGVNTIYIPNVYSVVISHKDAELMGNLLDTLTSDLATRLYAYASNNNYQMATQRPLVVFNVDDDMKLGEVYVIGETLSEEAIVREYGEDALPKAPASRQQRVAREADRDRINRPYASSPSRLSSANAYDSSRSDALEPQEYQPAPRISTFAPTGNFSANPAVANFAGGAGAAAGAEAAASALYAERPAMHAGNNDATQLMAPAGAGMRRITSMITVNHQPPFVLGGQTTYVIGRHGSCDILIEDPQASRRHAQFEQEGDGWAIADLDSTNGTLLNGEPVSHRRLKDGDVVTVGSTTIRYQETGL